MIWNEEISLKDKWIHIDEKMKKSGLIWFGHVYRRMINSPLRNGELIKSKEWKEVR